MTDSDNQYSETEMLNLIDQRDAAEEALSQAYYLVVGQSPEWSSVFGYAEAQEAIEDAAGLLRQEIQRLTADLTQCTAAYNAGVLELAVATARCERAEAEAARMRAALYEIVGEAKEVIKSAGGPQFGVWPTVNPASLGILSKTILDHRAALSTPRAEDVT